MGALNDILDLRGVGIRRGERQILSNVTWRVGAGEHWAVIGANGSGKTTLLRIATGYLWVSAGSVAVLGSRFGEVDLRQLRRRLGWVSAAIHEMVHPRQTLRQIVLSGAFASTALFDEPTDEQRRRAEGLLGQFGLGDVAATPFAIASFGERQRTLIARAMMDQPELLILDEPCAGLDIPGREGLLGGLESLAAGDGRTCLVLVTHHIEEITPAFTHALVLRGGRVAACGPKADVLTDEVLSDAFGVNVRVDAHHGRYWPRVGSRP